MRLSGDDARDLERYFRTVWLYLASHHVSRQSACEILAANPGSVVDSWNARVSATDCALRLSRKQPPPIADND